MPLAYDYSGCENSCAPMASVFTQDAGLWSTGSNWKSRWSRRGRDCLHALADGLSFEQYAFLADTRLQDCPEIG